MLRFIGINENKVPLTPFKTEEDKQNYSQGNCDNFVSASLIIPKGVVVIDFDEDNVIRDNNGEILVNKEKILIDYFIKNYNPYWTRSKSNHYHLYFKMPKDKKIKDGSADYFTCGGFQVDFKKDNNGLAVVKMNGTMREAKEKLTEEVINNLPELPILCYPLYYNQKLKSCFIDMKEHDGRDQAIFDHLISVYRKYRFSNNEMIEIGNFINKYLFKEPLDDEIVKSKCLRAKDYATDNSVSERSDYNPELDLICLDEIKTKSVDWLWKPYIPLGYITIVVGDPGVGKSYLLVDLCSRITNGQAFPFNDENDEKTIQGKIIFQNGEDGIEDTVKERFETCNANLKNVYIINEIENPIFSLEDLDRFENALKQIRPKLIIIDPVQRYIGNISMNSANEVRNILAPIGNLALKYNCSIILVMHETKSKNTGTLYRALGSIDFVGIARSMLTLSINDDGTRCISHTKSTKGKKGDSISFNITEKGIIYLNKVEQIENNIDSLAPREEAKDFIVNILKENNGLYSATEITDLAKEKGISLATLARAKKELRVESIQNNAKWYWQLTFEQADAQEDNKNSDNLIN